VILLSLSFTSSVTSLPRRDRERERKRGGEGEGEGLEWAPVIHCMLSCAKQEVRRPVDSYNGTASAVPAAADLLYK